MVQVLVQTVPLVGVQLTIQYLRALNLAAVGNQAVHQLDVRHFKREEGHRHLIVGGDILGHGEGKRCLTHGRATGDDDQVGGLPARRDVVQLMVTCRHTRQTVLVGCGLLDDVDGIPDDGVYLGVVLLHVALPQLEQCALGLLHQVIYVNRLVEGHTLNATGKRDELAGQRLLGNDAGVILDIG